MLVSAAKTLLEIIDSLGTLDSTLEPFDNHKTQRMPELVIGKAQGAGQTAVRLVIGRICRQESTQIQIGPNTFRCPGIRLHGVYAQRRLNTAIRIKQIKHCRKPS